MAIVELYGWSGLTAAAHADMEMRDWFQKDDRHGSIPFIRERTAWSGVILSFLVELVGSDGPGGQLDASFTREEVRRERISPQPADLVLGGSYEACQVLPSVDCCRCVRMVVGVDYRNDLWGPVWQTSDQTHRNGYY
jgi:hypothetical protein